MASDSSGKRSSRKRTFEEEEDWFLVQYEDQPDTFRVLNQREVQHLDPEDEEKKQEGETVMAFWSADKEYYEALIIKISDDKNELLKERRVIKTSLRKSAVGKALLASDNNTRPKVSKKQSSVSKKTKKAKLTTELTDEEKAKKEETKKAKEAEKVEAEKKRNAGIAARIAQATKRISSQQQQNDNPHQSNEIQEGDNIHPLSLPAFRTQLSPRTDLPSTLSSKQPGQQNDNPHQSNEIQEGDNIHPLSLPAFRTQLSPRTDLPSTLSSKQPGQQNDNPHQSNELQEGDNIHPLSLPAFRTQSPGTVLPSTSNNKQPVNKQKTPHRPKDKTKKTRTAMPDASPRQPPASNKPASGRKQITNKHPVNVASDDEVDSEEAVIVGQRSVGQRQTAGM
ncbi:hypothetical protein OS493_012991 [Desmophyllum pertusum]|uniref:Uncharacterized protein n=1 Tax=Desmophyllum pertusum TaxID=174260 RepID=A0A9W9Z140_9CNID|nr:hypothetical protein OS493_012991 [Desmophyllum pertusum]